VKSGTSSPARSTFRKTTDPIHVTTPGHPVATGWTSPSPGKGEGLGQNRLARIAGLLLLCAWVLPVAPASALGPHEILVLANQNSSNSVELARRYASLRHVPDCNLIQLELPQPLSLEISVSEFNRLIRDPVARISRERGLDDHILAWVYSVDFPVRIPTKPSLSIQGLTFTRGVVPAPELIEKGSYASPLFSGPDSPGPLGFPPQSLDVQRAWIGKNMPVPSMMLGVTGNTGNTLAEIMNCLSNGVAADQLPPGGTICIVTNADIRSRCREWEFTATVRELSAQGVSAIITNAFPTGPTTSGDPVRLLGLMAGAAEIPEAAEGRLHFLPGAIAEHLTSFGAVFDNGSQTKITAWIRAGATASAGTVVEPFAFWSKFPHARVFAHAQAGCTILESFYGSIRCPLQILLIGEPLAAPRAAQSQLVIQGLSTNTVSDRRTVSAEIKSKGGEVFTRFLFLLDGRTLQLPGKDASATLDPSGLSAGHHTLRIVAYTAGSVRSQIFSEIEFEVK
jgi:hypothetical protein